ncbi:MAG TPA: cytochrome c oxidase subunit II [Candidatus Methylomirabilis sp.]|nr:cytochrome c oxidase subunit II [Candidatus Methylomirabilis sp.]
MMSWLPENVATYGAEIDSLFYLIYYITGATFVLVTAALVVFLVVYRERPGRRATYSHGNTALEMAWTIVPAVILVVLTFLSIPSWSKVKSRIPDSDLHVRITAKQFNWEVTYPGPDGKFDTQDDRTLDNEIHVPVGKPVVLHLRAKDVIHSLYIPHARFKQDAVPGREILQWVEISKAPKAGTPDKYEVPCAELCGFGHSGMKGFLFVHTPEDYQAWVKETWAG